MTTLRLLMIEDSCDDADLLCRELNRKGYEVQAERVETGEAFQAALRDKEWDLVISDWNMPRFSAPEALEIFSQHEIDIPFIIVSGSVAEEAVVRAMKAGAHDFFSKGMLTLLTPAIDRELREAAIRREQTQMREQLMISDRMASLGILAAGVAHEINNPLSAVVGNLHLALTGLGSLESAHPEIEELPDIVAEIRDAHEAGQRIRDVAMDLKLFARSDNESVETIDVRAVIESSLRMAQNEIRHRARLTTALGDIPPVAGNESRLGQVLLNLIVNAAQAITQGASADNEIFISAEAVPPGHVTVTVRDTGVGMPEEVMKNIFAPFFTTKPVGIGTGLGLSICHRIITEMGGTITVESTVGSGTTFKVELQAAVQVSSEANTVRPVGGAPSSRRGKILVIDDEQSLGMVVQRGLKNHEVSRSEEAEEALDWIAQGSRYDVIFCDLMMPGVDGIEFYHRLEQVAADQLDRVIFLTGGAFTVQARAFLDGVDNLHIDKPFDITELRSLVSERVGG
jgi:signal transduction histidine kinase